MPVPPESNQSKAIHQAATLEAKGVILDKQRENEGGPSTGPAFGGPVAGLKATLQLLENEGLVITGGKGKRKIDVPSG